LEAIAAVVRSTYSSRPIPRWSPLRAHVSTRTLIGQWLITRCRGVGDHNVAVSVITMPRITHRTLCRVRNASLTAALTDLVAAGRARKDAAGYVISR